LVEIFNKSSLTFDPFWSAVIVSLMEIFGEYRSKSFVFLGQIGNSMAKTKIS